jgi:hypothetical protein
VSAQRKLTRLSIEIEFDNQPSPFRQTVRFNADEAVTVKHIPELLRRFAHTAVRAIETSQDRPHNEWRDEGDIYPMSERTP